MAEPMTPEQQEELKKKLENMSPDELKEFQKQQCIFCHIVSGKVQAKKVYEDDRSVAVLDINPANPGHVVLLPKEHHMIMPQLPEEDLQHLFIVAKQLSNTLLKTLDVRGTNIIVANGPAAGQKAQHFMIHIIPRKEGDGLQFELPSQTHSDEALTKVADAAKKRLNELLGVDEKEISAQDIIKPKVVEADFKDKEESDEEVQEEADTEDNEMGKEDESDEEDKDDSKDDDDEDTDNEDEDQPSTDDDDSKDDDDGEIDLDSISKVLHG